MGSLTIGGGFLCQVACQPLFGILIPAEEDKSLSLVGILCRRTDHKCNDHTLSSSREVESDLDLARLRADNASMLR
jgi:hypothetical protein